MFCRDGKGWMGIIGGAVDVVCMLSFVTLIAMVPIGPIYGELFHPGDAKFAAAWGEWEIFVMLWGFIGSWVVGLSMRAMVSGWEWYETRKGRAGQCQ